MARTKHNDAKKAEILERQQLALEMRRDGLSYRKIAERLGVSYVQIRTDVERALQQAVEANTDKAEMNRQLELERLDFVTEHMSTWVMAGNTQAANAYIKAMERRAKLLGLDAPTHVILDVDPVLAKQLVSTAEKANVSISELFEAMIQELAGVKASE